MFIVNNFNISLTRVKIIFNKYEGAGNDFVIIDNRAHSFISEQTIIAKICNRRFGIGADGLILIEPSESHNFHMKYFNSDGFEGSMCGNGGRCAAHFAFKHSIARNQISFSAIDGVHQALIDGNNVQLSMNDVRHIEKTKNGCYLNTGSPHHVEFVVDTESVDVIKEGQKIRYSDKYAPSGTNVNFVTATPDKLLVRTYERGVEDETLSCGTGVTASAIAASFCGYTNNIPVNIQTRGGLLSVFFSLQGTEASDITLTGPATFVFSGEIEL